MKKMRIVTPTDMSFIQRIDLGMRKKYFKTKKGITLVELMVAMALTAFFAVACVMLIVPVSRIYTNTLDQNRIQLVADTVVDALRAECSKAIVTETGGVWIANPENYDGSVMEAAQPDSTGGRVLVFSRNGNYCETIASNYVITDTLYDAVYNNDQANLVPDDSQTAKNYSTRSIYDMDAVDKASGYVHYGYYKSLTSEISANNVSYQYVYPGDYYDFTNPFTNNTYLGCKVELYFHDLQFDSTSNLPVYVICDVKVIDEKGRTYIRSAALCF